MARAMGLWLGLGLGLGQETFTNHLSVGKHHFVQPIFKPFTFPALTLPLTLNPNPNPKP